METVYFQGNPCHTYGDLPIVGEKAPCFTLVDQNLKEIRCNDFTGKRVVLNIFPSLDTDVCAASVRRFNQAAAELNDTVVICVSMDLPFAAKRFCSAEGINNVVVASAFRSPLFSQRYGLELIDGPLAGLLARAVIIYDTDLKIIYEQLVDEITNEPDYRAALDALKQEQPAE
ncbi:MAG: thiol peroxidase [Bacteroides sp.]|nr:thiol peroxidase [Bacteroides sp.]MCM1379606.1 thiol peroxidase [Bacteroides sp.]MCM1446012.1 thiol peroxidase [Prevotella sp.]